VAADDLLSGGTRRGRHVSRVPLGGIGRQAVGFCVDAAAQRHPLAAAHVRVDRPDAEPGLEGLSTREHQGQHRAILARARHLRRTPSTALRMSAASNIIRAG
jgi:hypothetical protein